MTPFVGHIPPPGTTPLTVEVVNLNALTVFEFALPANGQAGKKFIVISNNADTMLTGMAPPEIRVQEAIRDPASGVFKPRLDTPSFIVKDYERVRVDTGVHSPSHQGGIHFRTHLPQPNFSMAVGAHLIVRLVGATGLYIAEVTQTEPLRLKVEEDGPLAHLHPDDVIIDGRASAALQYDQNENTCHFVEQLTGIGHHVSSGLHSLGVTDGRLHEILPA